VGEEDAPRSPDAATIDDDPFGDLDDPPAAKPKSQRAAVADDEDEPLDNDTAPPAPLEKPAQKLNSAVEPNAVRRDPFPDQEEEEAPAPRKTKDDDQPASPGPTIETDEADEPAAEPRRTLEPLLPEEKGDAADREIEIPAQRRGIAPALPLADEPAAEEPL